jgi:integrase
LHEIGFHDLCHSYASLRLNLSIPVIEVSRKLGHSRASITLDIYDHLIPGMQTETAQRIDDLISPIELHQITPEDTLNNDIEVTNPPNVTKK